MMRDDRACPSEARVVEAVRSGRDQGFLDEHLGSCPGCRDLAEVMGFMRTLAAAPVDEGHVIPEAGRLWWRAQLVRRWETERRVAHQVDRMYPVQAVVLALGALLSVVFSWPVIERWLGAGNPEGTSVIVSALLPAGLIASLVGGALALTFVTLLVWRDYTTE